MDEDKTKKLRLDDMLIKEPRVVIKSKKDKYEHESC